jgi:hypothetical protein
MNEKWGDGTPLEPYEYYSEIAKKYANWWQPEGEAILRVMCEITGLRFRQNILDVYVAPWFYAFSSPMVLGVIFKTKDSLIGVVTHEIIHRLLIDNTTYDYNYDFAKLWRKMFGAELSQNALVHVPVHAIANKLYVDIMNRPDFVELDKKRSAEYPDYVAAWDYVDRVGYNEVIKKLLQAATRKNK